MNKLKRRMMQKTNYKTRTALLKSGVPRLVIRKGLNMIKVQIVEYNPAGDRVLIEEISKNLNKYGWNGHKGNISAAYLTGMIAGLKAKKMGIKELVADIGMGVSSKANVLYATIKGAKQSGINIPSDESILPDDNRITGTHVEKFATELKKNHELYQKQFSLCLKNGFNPEEYTRHFASAKSRILSELDK